MTNPAVHCRGLAIALPKCDQSSVWPLDLWLIQDCFYFHRLPGRNLVLLSLCPSCPLTQTTIGFPLSFCCAVGHSLTNVSCLVCSTLVLALCWWSALAQESQGCCASASRRTPRLRHWPGGQLHYCKRPRITSKKGNLTSEGQRPGLMARVLNQKLWV